MYFSRAFCNTLTRSEDCLLSSHITAKPCTVVLTLGKQSSIVFSVAIPFFVGGGSCKEVGLLGIQAPKSYCIEELIDKSLIIFTGWHHYCIQGEKKAPSGQQSMQFLVFMFQIPSVFPEAKIKLKIRYPCTRVYEV